MLALTRAFGMGVNCKEKQKLGACTPKSGTRVGEIHCKNSRGQRMHFSAFGSRLVYGSCLNGS